MHILFLHKNFPAQFGQIATYLARNFGHCCTYVSEKQLADSAEIRQIQFQPESAAQETTHYCSRTFENQIWRSDATYRALRDQGDIRPDLIVAHSGFVSSLFLRELYPGVPHIGYFEYFYQAHDSDMDYRADLPLPPPRDFLRVRARNAQLLLDLHNCDSGYAPTEFQRSRIPVEYQPKISTIFDGIDTNFWRRQPPPARQFGGITIPDDHRVVTYVSRGFEAMRGFDIFLQVADRICRARSNVSVVVVGEDRIAYGGDSRFTDGKSFKHWSIERHRPDLSRIHFVGRLPPRQLAQLLSISDVHLYLTVPFVLSWSLMNALCCQCTVIASDTAPVREMIQDGKNGLLVNFFDVGGFVDRALDVLDHPADHESLAAAGREMIETRYSIPVCLAKMQELYQTVLSQSKERDDPSSNTVIEQPALPGSKATGSWPTKTLYVQLGDQSYPITYPFSPAMKLVLTDVFQGREYPLCLPTHLDVETIIDIGANVGGAAIWFHHHYPKARIVSYEPSPSVYGFLCENTGSIENIETRNLGLLDRDGLAELHLGKYHASQHSIVANEETTDVSEPITLRSASAEFKLLNVKRISILKIDTEGCELAILTDLRDWFDRIDAIFVEYHCEADRRSIDQLLAANFYLIRAVVRRANLGMLVYLSRPIADRNRAYVSPPINHS